MADAVVIWKDGDGKTLKTERLAYGETPAFSSETTPTKTATAQYTYTFNNTWLPEPEPVSPLNSKIEYTAQFDRTTRQYTITWKDGNGDILKAEPVAYGETPAYTGDTPTKQDDYLTRFIFNDTWSPEIMPVSGDAVYSAQFDEKKMYPVIFDTNEGSEVPFQSVLAGECAVKPDDPTWSGGNFVQWVYDNDRSVPYDFSTPVTSRVDLTAEWDNANNPYGEAEGCYVATCVYGSYDCPEVWTLRRFRDRVLARTWYGRLFIRTYYAVSPTIVKLVGGTGWFQSFWRARLDRMVASLQGKGFESTPYQDRKW